MSGAFIKVEGEVWCDKHGCVHEDSFDPYDSGYDNEDDCCRPSDHLHLYRRERRSERVARLEARRQEAKRHFARNLCHLPSAKGD